MVWFYSFLVPFSLRRTLLMAFKGIPLRVPVTETFFSTSHFYLTERECLDGASPHIARPVQALLHAHFGNDRVISRSFPIAWPPRSPDLNPCDF
ncbi:hypothetical protein AVEN_23803-1 [Araneus ventricosus]|uniref:Uncharacterized protein n=1 Tax=Araneus ventricosus TaxID=182803 RepID=A0A4Y2LX94_ARAVE|nr:hypothetical protein AVEN_8368-1 [Araneus ventricosus]GBN19090.1 hypothetical protein AVEN_23803-1 [Araneus ventricosus]